MNSARKRFVIFTPPDGWRIGIAGDGEPRVLPVSIESDEPAEVARTLADALRVAGHDGSPVLLAIGSSRCLSAVIPTAGLPRRGQRQAALYRMEERLPLAAEDLSAGFVFHNGTALGVCARDADVSSLADAFVAERVHIAAVCPTALLSLQGLRDETSAGSSLEADALFWQTGGRLDLLTLADSTPVRWLSFPAEAGDAALALATQVIARKAAIRVATINVDEALLRSLAELSDVMLTAPIHLKADHVAIRAAARVLDSHEEPAIDLLGGRSGLFVSRQIRRPLIATAAAALLLCVCLVASLLIRGARYGSLAQQADDRKSAAFAQLFPREPLPVGIESRLRAVEFQLRGAAREGQATAGASAVDAFAELRELLQQLPSDARYRITDLDIDGGRLSIQGEVSNHGDADAVATALRRSSRFTIDDPQTQQLDGSVVRFSIAGTVNVASGSTGGREP